MAIVKYGPTVAGIRGTASGLTFSANKTGPYVRLWSKGANARTTLQMAVRGNMSRFSPLWQSMTAGERADWDTFAATPPEEDYNSLGQRIYLSGWQWFCRIQQRLLSVGNAMDTTVPSDVAATPPASVTLALHTPSGAACTVTWPSGTFSATDAAVLTMQTNPTIS